eukprot:TRINITY_DN3101_c0_g1_i1.p1 TRINITY_DN3101_c0_g1~~TRINITY_DN3101_c0_g1_i1.p1  ORF type:complete len:153 (+),score=16.22 TRINITY_DN3101_c0_g1_i1:488-946(+)
MRDNLSTVKKMVLISFVFSVFGLIFVWFRSKRKKSTLAISKNFKKILEESSNDSDDDPDNNDDDDSGDTTEKHAGNNRNDKKDKSSKKKEDEKKENSGNFDWASGDYPVYDHSRRSRTLRKRRKGQAGDSGSYPAHNLRKNDRRVCLWNGRR